MVMTYLKFQVNSVRTVVEIRATNKEHLMEFVSDVQRQKAQEYEYF